MSSEAFIKSLGLHCAVISLAVRPNRSETSEPPSGGIMSAESPRRLKPFPSVRCEDGQGAPLRRLSAKDLGSGGN